MVAINKGDNTGAFGTNFLKIYLNNPNHLYIQRAIFQVNGDLEKEFIDPIFPIKVNFTGAETELLQQVNHCKLALWDGHGRRRTAEGKFTFFVKENRIKEPDAPDCMYEDISEEDNSIHFALDDAEFVAQFTVNATPSKMSELQQDIPIATFDKIKDGDNIHTFIDQDGNLVINAEVTTEDVEWEDIKHKPTINGQPLEGDVHIEVEQVNADWHASEGPAFIKNKPNFHRVAYTGFYRDLIGIPTVPSKTSQLENDNNFVDKHVDNLDNYMTTEELQAKIDSGEIIESVNQRVSNLEIKEAEDTLILRNAVDQKVDQHEFEVELEKKANIQDVDDALAQKLDSKKLGNGKLSIYCNNNLLDTFSANATTNKDVNITIPTKLSQFENDPQYITKEDVDVSKFVNKTDYEEDKKDFANIDDIGSGIVTFKTNGTAIGTFNANAKSNKSINIEIPQNLSELNNDIEMLTEDDLNPIKYDISVLQDNVSVLPGQISQVRKALDDKVDVEPGKSLIADAELVRLSKLHDYDDTEVRNLIQENTDAINSFQGQIDNKVDAEAGKGLSTNDFTDEHEEELQATYDLAQATFTDLTKLTKQVNINTKDIDTEKNAIQALTDGLNEECTVRETTDTYLQQQIDAVTAKSTVADIVATEKELEEYDTSLLKSGDIISVIKDETKNDTTSYYRWNGITFLYIGSEGEVYTKAESNDIFVKKTRLVNGHDLSKDIILNAQDVDALPTNTWISNETITIQRNGVSVGTFTLNSTENRAIDINVADNVSELVNDAEYVDKDTLFTYIGDVPVDDNLQDQVDALQENQADISEEVEALKDLITGEIGGLPKVALTGSYKDLFDKPTKLSDFQDKDNPLSYIDKTFKENLKESTGYITADEVEEIYVKHDEMPTKLSEFENDRGYVTNNAIGRGILSVSINGHQLLDWMANEKDNYTLDIPVDSALSKTSTLPVQNNTVTNEMSRIDASAVHINGTETIKGTKTFTQVELGTKATAETKAVADNSTSVATTAYVKNQDYCTNTNAVHKAQDETITGNKTFTGKTVLGAAEGVTLAQADDSKNLATTAYVKSQDYCTNNDAVHKHGNEVIQGNKTFNDTTTCNGIVYLSRFSHVPTPVVEDETNFFTDLVANVEFVQNTDTKINERIDAEVETLNDRIDNEVSTLNNTITTNVNTLNQTITNKETALNKLITDNKSAGDKAVSDLNTAAVHKADAETITGVKTFSSTPIITSGAININSTGDGSLQYKGTNFLRKATSGAVVLSGTDTIYVRPNGDTNQAGQLSVAKDGTVTGTKFVGALQGNVTGNVTGSSGSCTGNAATATKATQDASGNNIVNTYATKTQLEGYVPLATYNAKIQELTGLIEALTARVEALEGNE